MPKSLPDDLGKILADHERRLNALSSGNRLDHASLDGTTLYIKDEDGALRGRLGRQPDGSFGNVTVRVEPPPQPTAAILTVGDQAGTCQAKWDGGTFDGRRVPIVFGHVEVWAELVGGDWVPTVAPSDAAERVGTIRDRTGGEVTVALPQAGTWAVWLRLVGADRETAGPWSPVSTVEIQPLVDTEAIEQELEEARDLITEADERLTAGQQALSANLDDLSENRLPALRDRLDTIEPVIDDYDDRIASAQDGADSARATAEDLRDNVLPPLESDLTDLRDNRLPAAEDTLDQTRLGMENLRDVRLPELQDALNSGLEDANEWREVGAISATSLRVGSWGDNMILDPEFNDPDYWLANSTPSRAFSFGDYTRDGVKRRVAHVNVESVAGQTDLATPPFPCEAGQEYLLEFIMASEGSLNPDRPSPSHWCRIRWRDQDNNYLAFSNEMIEEPGAAAAWTANELSVKAPEGAHYFQVVWRFHGPHRSNTYRVASPRLRRRADANLLVDGAVQARHIIAEEVAGAIAAFLHISADQIDTDDLAAHLATIIELDAGQITSGQIDTSRINAEEMAAAVANFLTLDALEINVEQLAGEIANIVEVTTENLAAGSISTKHLAIGNFDNLWSDDWYGEESAGDYTFRANLLARDSVSRFNEASPPGSHIWRSLSTLHGRRRWTVRGSEPSGQVAFRLGPGRGITVKPGEQYAFTTWVRDMADNSELSWRIQFFRLDGSEGTGASHWQVLDLRGIVHAADDTEGITHTFTIPDVGWGTMYMVPFLRHGGPEGYTGSGIRSVMEPIIRKMVDGELLVDGAVQSRSVDTEEFFAAEAVIQKIWADIVRSRLIESQGIITEDMIATGAITTPKLTVTEELVGRIASFLRIEAGSLASNDIEAMRIVSSLIESTVYSARDGDGNETVRLDGMNNHLRGSISAGVSDDAEIRLDYGTKTRRIGLTDEGDSAYTWSIQTPYLDFHTGDVYQQDGEPSIYIDQASNGRGNHAQMIINPGYPASTPEHPDGVPPYRARLNIAGDVVANRVEARHEIISPVGLRVQTGSSSQPGGLYRDGARTRLDGRTPDLSGPHDMITTGISGGHQVTTGQYRGAITWAAPAPSGSRRPSLSCHTSSAAYDNYDTAWASTSSTTSSGFNWVINASWTGGTRNVWLHIVAAWQ